VRGGTLARALKEKGVELGLKAVGIASAGPSDHAEFLERWLASGYAATMEWMRRTAPVRADLGERFPWVRSAVVASLSYLPYAGERHDRPGLVPHVSRYALGRDYHRVLGERLEALAAFLRGETPGAEARVYVDTGPVLERELAARAGLGWFGKHANLIAPGGDSWIFLGVILTDRDLPPDTPVPDRCGTCTACLEACPTGAIPEPYVVDSRRCLSYLTIEHRGAIPREQHPWLDDWLFGCDLCQEVCPWNRKVAPTAEPVFGASEVLLQGDLLSLVSLDGPGFRRRFVDSPLERPRLRGLVRNALIVAANTGSERALDGARAVLEAEDPVLRATAAWALGRRSLPEDRRALERALRSEEDEEVCAELGAALESGSAAPGQKE
jgi:epoxyqueuosine reductase